jgi:hypothetical protein
MPLKPAQAVMLLGPGLGCLRMARRARSVLAQQLDPPSLPRVVVVGARAINRRERRRQHAIEGLLLAASITVPSLPTHAHMIKQARRDRCSSIQFKSDVLTTTNVKCLNYL